MASTTRVLTPFTAESTTNDVISGIDLTGKRAIVTGASSGLGIETARALAAAGAEVTLAVRDVESTKKVAAYITTTTSNPNVFIAHLDLDSHASITAFTQSWTSPLHILVLNAAVAVLPALTLTSQGYEQQFATNHLGHFELALGLHPALTEATNARVVAVSSGGHRMSPIFFDDIHYSHRPYNDFEAYGQSKTANVLFAVEASKRWEKDGIRVNACHPGVIRTNVTRYWKPTPEMQKFLGTLHYKTLEQGASTQVLLAASPLVEGVGGRYFEHNNEAEIVDGLGMDSKLFGVRPHALDPDMAAKLWEVSMEMIQQRYARDPIRSQPASRIPTTLNIN